VDFIYRNTPDATTASVLATGKKRIAYADFAKVATGNAAIKLYLIY